MGYKTFLVIALFLFLFLSSIIATGKLEDSYEKLSIYKNNKKIDNLFLNINEPKNLVNQKLTRTYKSLEYVPGEIIVKLKEDYIPSLELGSKPDWLLNSPSINVLNQKYNLKKVDRLLENNNNFFTRGLYRFYFPKDINVFQIAEEYEKNPYVEYAEPNYIFHICSEPNDTFFDQQWALNQSNDHDIDAPEAWDYETGDSNVVIAVIDTGVDWEHVDLADNIWNNTAETVNGIDDDGNGYIDDIRGWDFVYNDSNPMDDHNHGTHCAGIIGAVGNNGVGVSGVCWNCSIMPVKAINSWGGGYETDLANAIIYAADNGADIISMSWGGYFDSSLIRDAIDYAYSKGVVLVAAAGNSNTDTESYPAAYSHVIAVAAVDENDEKAYFSNWGTWVDVAAPGVNILSTIRNDNYDRYSGTSMACPFVAGLSGLILSNSSTLTPEQVKSILKSKVDYVSSDYYIGTGRINAYRSILNITVPTAIINSSISENELVGVVNITGTANGSLFTNYTLYYGIGEYPTTWAVINSSSSMVNDSVLGQWNTTLVNDGVYTLRLIVNDSNGYYGESKVLVSVNNIISTLYVGGSGPDNYTNIQEAIDAAGSGDTVYVFNGTYYENLMISKNLNLIGENQDNTVIDGNYSLNYFNLYTIWVDATTCNIYNFTINNSGFGVIYTSSNGSIIQNNNITNSMYGIYLIATSEGYGINNSNFSGKNPINNQIIDNTFYNNLIGVMCEGNHSLIYSNIFYGRLGLAGVAINGCNNIIQQNNITNQSLGIYLYNNNGTVISDNIIYNSSEMYGSYGYGMYLYNSNNNTINGNRVYNSTYNGIFLDFRSRDNTITENSFSANQIGIYLGEKTDNSTISRNTVTNNQNGVYVYGDVKSAGNIIDTIFNDSFEDGDISDWSIYDISGSGYTWNVGDTLPWWADLAYKNGNYFLIINDDAAPYNCSNTDSAVTPLINCENNSNIYLYFAIELRSGKLWVNVSNNNGTTWSNVYNKTSYTNGFELINISSIADGKQILINFTYDDEDMWGFGALIDDIIVAEYDDAVYYNQETLINLNNIYNNTGYGLFYNSTSSLNINALYNWWGNQTGPYNQDTNINGTGDSAIGPVNYKPWLLYIYDKNYSTINRNTGERYNVIQDAIDNASNNDSILVYYGTYYENLEINKTITLLGGISPILNGMNNTGITIESNSTVIRNFTVTNCSVAAIVVNGSNVTIENASITESYAGIVINSEEGNNTIYNCVFTNCDPYSIFLGGSLNSSNNTVVNNVFRDSTSAVCIESNLNSVLNNTMDNLSIGIAVEICNRNILSGNSINNTIFGIEIAGTYGNTVVNNSISNNSYGILFYFTCNTNNISLNRIFNNNHDGISIQGSSSNNTIMKNYIYNCGEKGINLSNSSNNFIYLNNFINNSQHAFEDQCNNTWYDASLNRGNYWDDYNGSDANSDGIGDTPYNISGGSNSDNYPLMYAFENYYTLKIIASTQINENTQFTITVKTLSGTTVENANVSVFGSSYLTNSNGKVTLTSPNVNSDTQYTITVSKPGYTGNSTNITVKNVVAYHNNVNNEDTTEDTTGPNPPGNIRCISPVTSNTPSFEWDAASDPSGIKGYYVKIDKNPYIWIGNVLKWTSSTAVSDGNHTFYVKAVDNKNNNGTNGSCSFKILTANLGKPPVSDPGGPYKALTFENIIFDGSKSYDIDGSIVNYTWYLGNGEIRYGISFSYAYNTPGLFNVTLKVKDDDGLENSKTTTANITLDTDGDGWSDVDEQKYYTDVNNSDDYPPDNDFDKIPDYIDEDDDNDGLQDYIENTLHSDPDNSSDVVRITIEENKTFYLVDQNNDGTYDILYNSTGRITQTKKLGDNTYFLDVDGDSKYDYVYNYANQEVSEYKIKEELGVSWEVIGLIGIVLCLIALLIGYIWGNKREDY